MNASQCSPDFLATIMTTLGHAPTQLIPGVLHRFGHRNSCWAKLFEDGLGGVFGDFRQNISERWIATIGWNHFDKFARQVQVHQVVKDRQLNERRQWEINAMVNAEMWSQAQPPGDAVRAYLHERGLSSWRIPNCIRQHPSLPYWQADEKGKPVLLGSYPAMLAQLTVGDRLVALHRTYLGNHGKADVPSPRKLTRAAGTINGACIPLANPCGGVLGIAEGIETAAAASLGSGLPVVAASSASALASSLWPRHLEHLTIFADNDPAGQKAATKLAHRAEQAGLTYKILTPDKPGYDWADVWKEGSNGE